MNRFAAIAHARPAVEKLLESLDDERRPIELGAPR